MWQTLKIDFVAPPFGGHLYPLLELASALQRQGMTNIRILSTAEAQPAISLMGLIGVSLLSGQDVAISAIANPPYQVKSNPWRLLQQFSANLALMQSLKAQLRSIWQTSQPDLVIADFTLPIVGILAQEMDICWWTSTPTICAIETKTGTPTYLGGLTPGRGLLLQLRDFMGRQLIRRFKLGIGYWFRQELRSLNFPSVYLENGYERIYSPDKILGFGMREFEFDRDWPAALEFIGPLTTSPPFSHHAPVFQADIRHILVSLGTHIPWSKQQAAQVVQQIAAQMSDVHFHFSYGKLGEHTQQTLENTHFYDYLPYDLYIHHFDAAIIHGGTGVLYSCIKAGVPMLVWPHDYDQFDHAARIIQRGIGLPFKADLKKTIHSLYQLLSDEQISRQAMHFQHLANQYDPTTTLLNLVKQLAEIRSHDDDFHGSTDPQKSMY